MYHGSALGPELRVTALNGRDELSIVGPIDESNVIAVCERISERIRSQIRNLHDIAFDLSDRSLEPLVVGQLMRCIGENLLRLKSLDLSGNRLNDFDIRFCLGSYIEIVSGRFLADLDLSNNLIGDFGCICILKSLVEAKNASTDRRITRVDLRNNLITHPYRLIEAIPAPVQPLIFAPGISHPSSIKAALIHVVGLDDQRFPKANRDVPQALSEHMPRMVSMQEPDADEY